MAQWRWVYHCRVGDFPRQALSAHPTLWVTPGTGKLSWERRSVYRSTAIVGEAWLPPCTCTAPASSFAVNTAEAARWASWMVQPTKTKQRMASAHFGLRHSAGCRPGVTCTGGQARGVS